MEEALTLLLAAIAGGRRFWGRAPQDTIRPYVVMQRIDGVPAYNMQGASDYVASRVQFDCYAETYTETKATARALVAVVSGYSGGDIQGIFVESQRDLPVADAGDVKSLFRISIDITVHHGE